MFTSARLRTPVLLLLILAGLALLACGGGSDASSDSASDAGDASVATTSNEAPASEGSEVAAAASSPGGGAVSSQIPAMAMLRTQELDSIRFAMVIGISDLPGYPGDVELTIEGAADQTNGSFEMSMDFGAFMEALAAAEGQSASEAAMVSALFGDGVIEIRQVGDTAYMRWPALSALFGAETEWVSFPSEDSVDSSFDASALLGSQELLDELASIGTVTNLGGSELHGVAVTGYEALIDYSTAYGSLESGAPIPLDSPEIAALEGLSIPLVLWIDDDGLVRRMTMDFNTADFGLSAAELADSPGSISLQFDILEVGGTVVVLAPPAADVTDMTQLGGGSLLSELF